MKTIILSLLMAAYLMATQNVTVYTYHNHAPFIIEKGKGLTYDFVEYLNQQGSGEYKYIIKVVPRSRLNYILKPWINQECGKTKKCDENFVVLWVNHKWGFGKQSLINFKWFPLFVDSNIIVSASSNPLEYTQPADLIGKKLAGVSGHKYVGIDPLVKEGKINRIDGNSEYDNLKVVLASRVDGTLLPRSAFRYYQSINDDFKSLHVAKVFHQKYLRNIMTTSTNTALIKELEYLKLDNLFK